MSGWDQRPVAINLALPISPRLRFGSLVLPGWLWADEWEQLERMVAVFKDGMVRSGGPAALRSGRWDLHDLNDWIAYLKGPQRRWAR